MKRETRFTSQHPANEIMCKIEETAKPLGFNVHKRDYKAISLGKDCLAIFHVCGTSFFIMLLIVNFSNDCS